MIIERMKYYQILLAKVSTGIEFFDDDLFDPE